MGSKKKTNWAAIAAAQAKQNQINNYNSGEKARGETLDKNYTAQKEAIVQKDDHIITGKGQEAALEFGYTILESLGYDSSNLRQGMQYEYLMNVEAHKE